MTLPNPQTITDGISQRLKKIAASKGAAAVFDLLTGKFMFLLVFLVTAASTADVLEKQLAFNDTMLYYALPVDEGCFYPNAFFGVFEPLIGDFDMLAMVLKGIYLVLVIFIALCMMFWLKRISSPIRRMEFAAIAGAFMKLLISTVSAKNATVDLTSLALNLMLALALMWLVSVVMHSLKLYLIPVAMVLTAISQVFECRTIMLITPALVFLFIFAKKFVGNKAVNLRILCVAMVISSIVMLVITNIFSENNVYDVYTLGEISAYLKEYGDPEQNLEYISLHKLLGTTVLYQLNTIFQDAERFFIYNNAFLIAAAFVISLICAVRKKAKAVGENITIFRALHDIFNIDEENKVSKILLWGVLLFLVYTTLFLAKINLVLFVVYLMIGIWIFKKEGFKYPFSVMPDLKRVALLSLVFVLVKHLIRILIYPGRPFALMHYYVSYQQFGFLPRAVVGTLFNAVLGYKIPEMELLLTLKILFILMLGLLVLFIVRNYQRAAEGFEKKLIFLMSFAFMVSSGFMIFSHYDNLFKIDLFNIILAILCIVLSAKNNGFVCFVPAICFVAMLTHQVFTCTIFPVLFIILVYRAFVNNEGHPIRNISVLFLTFFVVAGTFGYFTFIYEVPEHLEMESCVALIDDRSGKFFEVYEEFFKYIWLDKDKVRMEAIQSEIMPSQKVNAIIIFVLSSPLLYMFYYALNRSAKMETKIFPKLAYLVMGLSALMVFPPFFTDIDYGRWYTYYLFTILIGFAVLSRLQPQDKKWYEGMDKKYLLKYYLISAVILASFQTFDSFLGEYYAFLP